MSSETPPSTDSPPIRLGTSQPLDAELLDVLRAHGIDARAIPEDEDPAEVDLVLVVRAPSPLIGRCRGRWPVIVAVEDPRATDVSRLLRGGANDVVRHPISAVDLVNRIRRAVPSRHATS